MLSPDRSLYPKIYQTMRGSQTLLLIPPHQLTWPLQIRPQISIFARYLQLQMQCPSRKTELLQKMEQGDGEVGRMMWQWGAAPLILCLAMHLSSSCHFGLQLQSRRRPLLASSGSEHTPIVHSTMLSSISHSKTHLYYSIARRPFIHFPSAPCH